MAIAEIIDLKLARIGEPGAERPGILDSQGRARDLSAHVKDLSPDWLANGGVDKLRGIDVESLPRFSEVGRVGAPLSRVGKIVCVGLNYSDHAAESGMDVPSEPILFLKGSHTVQGPNDDVYLPRGSLKSDWEVELGVVIGKRALYVSEERAPDYIAGYCVCNDLSERAFQLERGGQWDKGKNCDTFGPIGPWIVTSDEVANPQSLGLWLDVNDRRFQDGSTSTMVFGVRFLVHYISQFMPLEPGDVISTGTPPGVGIGQKPPIFLKAGDRMRLGIQGLGEQNQHVLASR
jgi:2-keto-4-pentenoate hydratase/2-oxohepta-3-ene-1,7-dioic acid hydratase in catechol pathway